MLNSLQKGPKGCEHQVLIGGWDACFLSQEDSYLDASSCCVLVDMGVWAIYVDYYIVASMSLLSSPCCVLTLLLAARKPFFFDSARVAGPAILRFCSFVETDFMVAL